MARKKRGISFLGAMTILIAVTIIHPLIEGGVVTQHMSPITVMMMILYFMIGLATDRYDGVSDMVERVWQISNNGDTDNEKFKLIKSFIEINVYKWDAYWSLYQEIVEGKEKTGRAKRAILKIPKGSISMAQFSWIMAYIVYNIVKGKFFPMFDQDIAFIIDFIGLGYFVITSSSVIGMKEFMTNVFKSLRGEDNVKQALNLLESHIIFGARQYGFLKGKIDLSKNDELLELIKKDPELKKRVLEDAISEIKFGEENGHKKKKKN